VSQHRQSELRRVANELAFKQYNQQLQAQVTRLLPSQNRSSYKIGFVCECSDETCHEKIELTVNQFRRYSVRSDRFLIKPGHQESDIEKIVETRDGYAVVEKFMLPPDMVNSAPA
jgi:hypothetical protein